MFAPDSSGPGLKARMYEELIQGAEAPGSFRNLDLKEMHVS
jgi:hypothetical protein